jgi:hypothetical protein
MFSAFPSVRHTFFMSLLLALGTAACGKKPDGTPYGVDPARLPEGRRKAHSTTLIYKKDMPKGAEMNAVTNAAKTGQPTGAQPLGSPTR